MMTDHPTPEEVRASIVPKSDQLNAEDLLTGPITVTITKVRRGDREQPIIVEIEGHRPYKPCKTMRRVLIAVFSDDPAQWIGQQMTLYCDPEVTWGGVKVGGIRISHLSGIDNPRTFMLSHARGKRREVTVRPIEVKSLEDEKYIVAAKEEIATVDTMAQLCAYGDILKGKSKAIRDALRPIYAQRVKDFEMD